MGERERGGHAAEENGQDPYPGRCVQDRAFMVRALPGEPPGCPRESATLMGTRGMVVDLSVR